MRARERTAPRQRKEERSPRDGPELEHVHQVHKHTSPPQTTGPLTRATLTRAAQPVKQAQLSVPTPYPTRGWAGIFPASSRPAL